MIFSYYDFTCQLCDKKVLEWKNQGLVIHHTIPTEMGGKNTWGNIIVLCRKCHFITHKALHQLYTKDLRDREWRDKRELKFIKGDISRAMIMGMYYIYKKKTT